MTPTPLTDAAAIHVELDHPLFKSIDYVTLDFARGLSLLPIGTVWLWASEGD